MSYHGYSGYDDDDPKRDDFWDRVDDEVERLRDESFDEPPN